MDRVTGADESYMLAERLFGLTAPMQYLWVYPTDPGREAIERLHAQLAAGSLGRKVVRARVAGARDRWVRADVSTPLVIQQEPIGDDSVSDWVDERLRAGRLRPTEGFGWQLDVATTDKGRVAISLLVSHMIADGQGTYRALDAAQAGTSSNALPSAESATGRDGLVGDLRDALGQYRAALVSSRIVLRSLWSQCSKKKPASSPAVRTRAELDRGTTLAIYDIDREQWAARARELGGTPNSLFTAVLVDIVRGADYPERDEGLRVCIAVSRRTDGDERANASGGVWIRLPDPVTPETGLARVRALSKDAFVAYAESGDQQVADNLQSVVRLLPKRVLAPMMRSVPGPDTTVSNVGLAPETVTELGGVTAESFAIRALMGGTSAAERRGRGPAIAAWAVEYEQKVTLTFFGIDPDYFGDTEDVRKRICAALDAWGLSYSPW